MDRFLYIHAACYSVDAALSSRQAQTPRTYVSAATAALLLQVCANVSHCMHKVMYLNTHNTIQLCAYVSLPPSPRCFYRCAHNVSNYIQ